MDSTDGKRVMTQPEKVEYIMDKGCEFFGLTRQELVTKDYRKSKMWYKKRFILGVLSDETALSLKEIAGCVGLKNHSTILYHKRCLDEELSEEVYGSQRTKTINKEFLSYLNL